MDAIVLIGAGCVAVIVFIIASNAMASHSSFSKGSAQVIAGIVGLLVILSFLDSGAKGVMSALLLPYAALGVTCVVLVLYLLLARCLRGVRQRRRWFPEVHQDAGKSDLESKSPVGYREEE